MRIIDMKVRRFERDLPPGLSNPVHRWSSKSTVLVFLIADNGLVGVGEACTSISAGETIEQSLEREVRPAVVGRNAFDVRDIWQTIMAKIAVSYSFGVLGAALSGVDIALWDLIGQHARLPCHRLFGTASREVYGYASAGLYGDGKGVDELADEMRGYIEAGFDGVKLKIGGAALDEDAARVSRVREVIGPSRRLMIDGAGAIRPTDALDYARRLQKHRIHFFEAPISVFDIQGMVDLRAKCPIPLTSEYYFGRYVYRDIVAARAADTLQLNVTVSGGFTECFRITALASAANMACTFQCAGSFVALAATIQFAAATEICDSVEFHMVHNWLTEYAAGNEFTRTGSTLIPGDNPGIGLTDATRRTLMEGG